MLRTVKKSYACRHCDPRRVPAEQRLQTAGPAQVGPIAKGLCGPGLLAHVITAKFADHVPAAPPGRATGALRRDDRAFDAGRLAGAGGGPAGAAVRS